MPQLKILTANNVIHTNERMISIAKYLKKMEVLILSSAKDVCVESVILVCESLPGLARIYMNRVTFTDDELIIHDKRYQPSSYRLPAIANVDFTHCTFPHLKWLAHLTERMCNLKDLDLSFSSVTESSHGLAQVLEPLKLNSLMIAGTNFVDDEAVKGICKGQKLLISLNVANNNELIRDEHAILIFESLPLLQVLHLTMTKTTDTAMVHLLKMKKPPRLQIFGIQKLNLTPEITDSIFALYPLAMIHVENKTAK
jgi:hypothetical protein